MSGIFESLSGASAVRAQGRSAQNIANFNAAVSTQEAKAQREKSAFEQRRQSERAARVKSALTARIAKAGGLGSPVAADLAAEQAAELELENLIIGFEGEVAARRFESQAVVDTLQGKLVRQRGKAAGRAANIKFATQLATLPVGGAGGTLLTGFA